MTPRHRGRHVRKVAVGAALALLLPLLPLGAMAHAHRDAPNNPCGPDTPPAPFADRDQVDEAHRANVDCIASLGVAEGRDGPTGLEYAPDALVLRDQMASFVARSLEAAGHELPVPSDQGFEDIDGNIHEDRINQLAEIGVVEGRTETMYAPSEGVRRDQMAAYVMRAASWAHGSQYDAVFGPYFEDTAGNVHGNDIDSAYEVWVVAGRTLTAYDPSSVVRRGPMASYLSRTIDLIHPENFQSSNQNYIVAPQEAIEGMEPGEPFEFSVGARYDGRPFTGPVDIALVPCSNAEPTESPVIFRDDGNGLADGVGSTDGDQAYISAVNGEPTEGRVLHVRDAHPGEDGILRFTVVSPNPDCAVVLVFDPRVPESMRLDAGQRPAEPFGVGKISWS